jgi:hypothetical protein
MTTPKFDPTVSLGNLISVAAMLLSLGVMWGVHSSTVAMLVATDLSHDSRLESNARAIQTIEVSAAETRTSLSYIKAGIDEIKKKP